MHLSKSQYIRGIQCHKSLWLYKHNPELRKFSKDSKNLFKIGYEVGDMSKKIFPNGVEIEFDQNNFDGMIQKTKELVDTQTDVIYEATFNKNGLLVMVDILVRNGMKWDIYEVKASTRVKEYHLEDVSFQWHVVSQSIDINKAYVVHINDNYTRQGELQVEALFCIVDVTNKVKQKQDLIAPTILEMKSMIKGEIPDIDIGLHCKSPNECDFVSHCWQHVPKKNSVFTLAYAKKTRWELYQQGFVSLDHIPEGYKLGKKSAFQVKHHKSQEIKIDKDKIRRFLETIKYPINFFDFETFQNTVPRFDNQKPYSQVPFQYSLHILHEDGKLEHKEFLGDEYSDPRDDLVKQMLKDFTQNGSIVAYNKSFEITQIKNLALVCPDSESELTGLIERIVDLALPFEKRYYYHPDFNGRYSIKVIVPAMFPNDDELNYKKLGAIQNGGDAMKIFANLHLRKDKSKLDETKNDLLAYCRLDTLAMVKIWEKLNKLAYKEQVNAI